MPTGKVSSSENVWSKALAADHGVELAVRAQRAQILVVDTGGDVGTVPVFSDLVSLQYVRREGPAGVLWGDSDHSQPEWAERGVRSRAVRPAA